MELSINESMTKDKKYIYKQRNEYGLRRQKPVIHWVLLLKSWKNYSRLQKIHNWL